MSDWLTPEVLSVKKFLTDDDAPRKVIPRYQRGYSWNKDQITDLLYDVDSAMTRNEPKYFLGTMICIRRQERGGGGTRNIMK